MITYVFRALPLKRDSRTQRYSDLINDKVILNTWEDNYSLPKKGIEKFKIGRNKIRKFISYPFYLFYLFLYSLINIKSDDRVICMELDTFMPIMLGSFLKKNIIYLDIVDPVGQAKFRKLPFNKIFDIMEFILLKNRTYNILPNINRLEYYKDRLNVKIEGCSFIVVENVPLIIKNENKIKQNIQVYDIGYFGTLDESRGLIELIEYSKKNNISLLIAGIGPLESFIKEKSLESDQSQLKFIGSFMPSELSDLYSSINFTWAYYTNKIFLHKYASPNKYYEHLAYKKPIIMNEFIPLSKNIKLNKTGVIIIDELNNSTFYQLKKEMLQFNVAASNFNEWETLYKNYTVDFDKYEGKK